MNTKIDNQSNLRIGEGSSNIYAHYPLRDNYIQLRQAKPFAFVYSIQMKGGLNK